MSEELTISKLEQAQKRADIWCGRMLAFTFFSVLLTIWFPCLWKIPVTFGLLAILFVFLHTCIETEIKKINESET